MNLAADRHFEHDADIGVIGRGATLEQALVSAAEATFALMADPAALARTHSVDVEFLEADPEFALVEWLNGLLSQARVAGLALGAFELSRDGERWHGRGWGEPWRAGIERGTEVKGATLTGLSVRRDPQGAWEARCVVDV